MLACRALTKTLRCGFVPYPGAARPVSHGAWMAVEGPRMFGVEGPGFQKRAKEEQKYHEPHFPASFAAGRYFSDFQADDKDKRPPGYSGSASPADVKGTGADPSSDSSPTPGLSTPGGAPTSSPAGGSGSYLLLATAHAGLATTAMLAPALLVNAFFPGTALPQGMQTQVLGKLLGGGVALGAASCYALKKATDAGGGGLTDPTAQRLQLGLMAFSAGAIGLHLMYAPAITMSSLAAGAAVMSLTFAVPYSTYTKNNPKAALSGVLGRYFKAVPDHFNITGLNSALYSLLTPTLALAGASYLFMPEASLAAALGYVKDRASLFLWQNIGGGLLTIAPAVTYSLKKKADAGELGDPVSQVLNVGLLAAALGHVSVLLPMVTAGQGGPVLPWFVGAWSTASLASALGLFAKSKKQM